MEDGEVAHHVPRRWSTTVQAGKSNYKSTLYSTCEPGAITLLSMTTTHTKLAKIPADTNAATTRLFVAIEKETVER